MVARPITSRTKRLAAVCAALAIAFTASACQETPWTYFTSVPASDKPAPLRYRDAVFSVTKTSNITWSTAPDLAGNPVALTLDLYQPTGDTVAKRPAIVVAHSGGFYVGSKTNANSVDLANTFAAEGYVVISINYRLLAKVDCGQLQGLITDASGCRTATMAATSDGQAAVRWLRANAATYRVDPARIGMIGDSAGALMSILSGMLADVPNTPDEQSSIDAMGGAPANTTNLDESSEIQGWVSISGGLPPTETPGLAEKLAVAPTQPAPGYLFSGTKDTQVPYSWAEATRDELVKDHRIVFWGSLEGAGHVPYTQYGDLFRTQSSNFFALTLGHDPADDAPDPLAPAG